MTNIKLDDIWRGTNESFLMHNNDQLRLLDSLVDSDEKLPDNTRVTFLESAVESVPDLRRVKITDNVLQAQLDSTRPISYRSYFDLLKDAAFHLDQATKRGNKIRCTYPQQSPLFPQSISIRVHPKSLIGMPYAHSLHGHPHPASRTLSMSPPGMELLHIPRITSRNTLSLEILSSTSPDAVKLLQQTPSSLTPLLLMMVQPWPNFPVAVIPLSVMHMASNQPNNSLTPSLITSEKGEPWTPSSVMEANMKSPSESLISSGLCSFKIISLNLIINTKIRQKIVLDLPSVTPTLS